MRKPAHLGMKLLCLGVFAAIIAFFLYWDIPCLFRFSTGLICPACGMTRACLSAIRLDFSGALHYHPMFWSVPLFFLYILYDGRLFRNSFWNGLILYGLLGMLFVCYLIRLIWFLDGRLAI